MMVMKNMWNAVDGIKPTIIMVAVATSHAGANVFYKLAIDDGMSSFVFNAYRFIFASIFTIPLALINERKNPTKLTWRVIFAVFLCGLIGGTLFQNLYLESLALISPTFVAATFNLIPAVTFVLAVSFRLEKLNLGRATGKAKVAGTIIGIGGATMMTFYKGKEINIWSSHINLLHSHGDHQNEHHNAGIGHRVVGVLCGFGSCLSYASWLIIQGKFSRDYEEYPSHRSSTALMSTMAAIQTTIVALCVERDWSQWKLGWNIRLLCAAYSGIVASGVAVIAIALCIEMRGPLFVSCFNPLLLLLVAIAGSLLLDVKLYIGSVVGAALIVCGLYIVLWGKNKESKEKDGAGPEGSDRSTINSRAYLAKDDEGDSAQFGHQQRGMPRQGKQQETVSTNVTQS